MGFSSSIGRTLQQPMPMGQAFAYDKFGNQVPQSGNLFDIGIMPLPEPRIMPVEGLGIYPPGGGKGGGYAKPQPVSYVDNSYAVAQSPYGYSSRSNVGQQYSPMFSAPQYNQPQYQSFQSMPQSFNYQSPAIASYPKYEGQNQMVLPYPGTQQSPRISPFANSQEYQALMDYRKSLAPTPEQKARLQELRSAFEGTNAYKDYRIQQLERQLGMGRGLGGYRDMYGPRINRRFGGFQPYPSPLYPNFGDDVGTPGKGGGMPVMRDPSSFLY